MEKIKIKYIFNDILKGTNPQYVEEENENIIFGQRNNTKEGKMSFIDCKYTNDIFWNSRNEEEFLKYGDILINSLGGGTCGRVGFFDILNKKILTDGIPYILRPQNSNKYLYYVLKSNQSEFEKMSIGATNQVSLLAEDLKNYKVEIVNDELKQKKIVQFLDKKIVEIDNVIEKTKETIEDYKKYKKSFIMKVTTKGLNSTIEMKDTDSEWIGKIPKHWDYVRIKTLFNTVDERNEDENAILLSLYTSIGVKPRNELEEKGNKSVTVLNYKKVKKNDIIVNKLLAWMGAIAYSDYEGVTSPDYDVYRAREKTNVVKSYYNAYFRYTNFNGDCHRYGHGIMLMRWRTYPEELLRIKVPNPPYEEQIEIAKVIDKKCLEIDRLIENKKKIIEELEKYKKSLIYEYVTGKKDVSDNTIIKTNSKAIKINCKDNIFAQAILLCKVIEKLNQYNLGRVKAEKTLYLIEKDIGFEFDNNYVREAAGPLSESIYKCESVISKKNKWIKVNKVRKNIEYEILPDFSKYSKYYEKYYSNYDDQIEDIIEKVKNYSTDKSEMVATLYASWNDFLIKKEQISDIKIVRDVRENWNDTKKRFNEQKWLDVLEEMKQIELIPKGNGNLTIIKEN